MQTKKLILIAEDEPAYGSILKIALEKEGYEVIVAVNGDEFLKVARVRKSALVILDLLMPVKNGFQVLAEMKQDEQLKRIPVIALSNLVQDDDIDKARKLGVEEYIIKSDETFYTVIDKIKRVVEG